jgi:transcriptional regulator with XRE-family HTH domain
VPKRSEHGPVVSSTGQLGPRLRELRSKEGWSPGDLARATGISRAEIYRLETDPTWNPGLAVLLALRDAFKSSSCFC